MRLQLSRENRELTALYIPVVIEQGLSILIGIVSTIMVSNVGGFAVSGVNLVDTVNFMVIAMFNAMAAGATVVVAQCIGAQDYRRAGETARQAIVICAGSALLLGLFASALGRTVMHTLYGGAEREVLEAGSTYFFFSGFSYVFLGLSAACGGVMRASGNARTPMVASVLANIVNVTFAFIFIRLGLGVLGVSIAMLLARASGGIFCYVFIRSGKGALALPRRSLKLSSEILKPVLRVGIPSGIDSVIFNGARVLMTVFMSEMGTESLHANAIANSITSFLNLCGNSFSIVSVTVVGQAYGARLYSKVRGSMLKINVYASVLQVLVLGVVWALLSPLISVYGATPVTADLARTLVLMNGFLSPFLYGLSFILPQMLRAIGEAPATMYVSVASLLLLRVLGAWFFGIYLGWGVVGVWTGMFCDWGGRALGFTLRAIYCGRKMARL